MKLRRLILITIVIMQLILLGYLNLNNHLLNHLDEYTVNMNDNDIISFSLEPGIYDHSITIDLTKELKLVGDTTIFYTLDGNDPYLNSSYLNDEMELVGININPYDGPINIDIKKNDIKVVSIKAVVFYRHHYSKVIEKTYIVSDGDINQYTDLPIISISSNYHDLYDYYDGILNVGAGKEILAADNNPMFFMGNVYLATNVANGSVSMFNLSPNGYDNYSNVEITLGGQSSLSSPVKSFKLKNLNDNFIVTELDSTSLYYSNVYEFKTLKLRGGSQDLYNTNIRSQTASQIAYKYNSNNSYTSKQCVLYLNGEFYGIVDIENSYSSSNLKKKYSLPTSDIEELKNSVICTDNGVQGMDEEEFYNHIKDNYDIDNLMQYIAAELFINNTDWPRGNTERWRYLGESDNNKYSDGKYRMLLLDLDLMWWTDSYPYYFEGVDGDNFLNSINDIGHGDCAFFKKVLTNKYLINDIVNYTLDLMKLMYDNNYISNQITNNINDLKTTLKHYNKINSNYNYDDMYKNTISMRNKASARYNQLINDFRDTYNYDGLYNFYINNTSDLYITFNNNKIYNNESYSNKYFTDSTIELTANEYGGYKFDYWLINGEMYYDKTITINKDMIVNNKISIIPHSHYEDGNHIIISKVDLSNNTITLKNISHSTLNTDGMCLYNGKDKSCVGKYELEANEELVLDSSKIFKISKNDYITLKYDKDIIDDIYVYYMSQYEYIEKYKDTNVVAFITK